MIEGSDWVDRIIRTEAPQVSESRPGEPNLVTLSQLVWRPVRPRQQLRRPRIVQNLFFGNVPMEFPPHQHRNQPEVAGNGGVMRHFYGRDGRLARLHAVE